MFFLIEGERRGEEKKRQRTLETPICDSLQSILFLLAIVFAWCQIFQTTTRIYRSIIATAGSHPALQDSSTVQINVKAYFSHLQTYESVPLMRNTCASVQFCLCAF